MAIQGRVYGGNLPIVGARVYLFAASTGGYGTASVSLLNNVAGTTLDTSGGATNGDYYVTTTTGGAFSITGDYSCSQNTQVYLYAVGGNPGLNPPTINNAASGLLAVLGNCPGGSNAFLSSVPFVTMDEVSTVAAAYAFAGFATDATHVASSGTTLAETGIQNAFANAANLADLGSGTAILTPTNNSLNVAPQATVNSLADILASCVNTDGTISGPTNATACYTLFNNAKSGGSTGTIPSDTATAAINMAHNPGANVTTLFNLVPQNPPFVGLTSQPNDFTLGLQLTTADMSAPAAIAIDGSGNVWVANSSANSIDELTSAGKVQSGTSGFTGGGLVQPNGIAIDPTAQAYVWATNYSQNNVSVFTSSGTPKMALPYAAGTTPNGIAIDGTGNAWITNSSSNSVTELNSGGTLVGFYNHASLNLNLSFPRGIAIDNAGNAWVASTVNSSIVVIAPGSPATAISTGYNGGGLNQPYGLAIDNSGNAWIPNYGNITNSTVTELGLVSNAVTPVSGSPYTEGGSNNPRAIAIDGAGNAWVADSGNNSISAFSSAGALTSPGTGYTAGGNISNPFAIAVDGSGNVWVANNSGFNGSTLIELIGAATPVVTPLSYGVLNHSLGQKP